MKVVFHVISEKQNHFDQYKIRIYTRNKALYICDQKWLRKGPKVDQMTEVKVSPLKVYVDMRDLEGKSGKQGMKHYRQ